MSSDSGGETGGLSVKEPLRGPLLCESRPDVLGDTSCCTNVIIIVKKYDEHETKGELLAEDDDKKKNLWLRVPESM